MAFLREDTPEAADASDSDPAAYTPPAGDGKIRVYTLVINAQHGDSKAFEALYERYNVQIRNYLVHLMNNNLEIGSELTQETFTKAWLALPGLRTPSSFSGWLYQIATNFARSYHRKYTLRMRELPLELHLEEVEALYYRDGPEKRAENAELLRLAFSQVALKYRPCLYLTLFEDLPQRKIAELLGIKETFVATYLKRGMAQLRQAYLKVDSQDGTTDPGRKRK